MKLYSGSGHVSESPGDCYWATPNIIRLVSFIHTANNNAQPETTRDCSHGLSSPCCRMDGFVVCEEHREVLEAAWEEEQQIQSQREAEVLALLWTAYTVASYSTVFPAI